MVTIDPVCCTSQQPAVEVVQNSRAKLISAIKNVLFILTSALIIFVAFSNTLTWHLQHFWGSSGDFLQSQWNKICSCFGHDEYVIDVWGTFLFTFLIYWSIGLCYTFIDLTGKPSILLRYKIQDNDQHPVSAGQVFQVIQQVLVNQTLVGIPFGIFVHYLKVWRGYDSGVTLPTFQWVLFELILCVLMEEVGLYYFHRLMHHPRIYKYFHKRHHEWKSPFAITAVYCHPVEHIFLNLLPLVLGPILLGSHTATCWLWFTIVISATLNAHSGFHFPFCLSPELHDFHHLKFNQNFGALGILDYLHGTDSLFRNSKMHRRHIMSLSLVPLKQKYPTFD